MNQKKVAVCMKYFEASAEQVQNVQETLDGTIIITAGNGQRLHFSPEFIQREIDREQINIVIRAVRALKQDLKDLGVDVR
jgi:hypothetical protein